MHAVDALAHHSLRAPQRADALCAALRCASSWTAAAASEPAAKSSSARSAESSRGTLAGNGVRAVSKSNLRIGPPGTALTRLLKSSRGSLAHGDGANHLNRVSRSSLPKLPAGL